MGYTGEWFTLYLYFNMSKYVKVFILGAIIDVMYVVWIQAVATGGEILAGFAAVGLALPSLLGYLEIVENKKMMIPYLLGLFTGTVLATMYLKEFI